MANNEGLRILPTEQELIQQGSRPEDIQSIDNQFFYDRSGTDPRYVRSIYDYYMGGYEMPGSAADIAGEAALVPGVTSPVASDQGQGTGTGTTPIVDTTFQDAGATDVPGTIGTLDNLTTPTTIDQLDYTDAPVTVPALDLSGTSEELIDQGVIETPQEFANRAYGLDYEALDQEEQNIIDEDYATKYSLPTYTPSKGLEINVPSTIANIIGKYITGVPLIGTAVDYFTDDKDSPVSEGIDFDTYADPGVDAEENQPINIENIVQTEPNVVSEIPAIEPYADPDEVTEGLTYPETTSPVQWDESDDLESDATALETALGLSPTTYETPAPTYTYEGSDEEDEASNYETPAPAPAPTPVYTPPSPVRDSGNGDSGGGGGSSSSDSSWADDGYW